MERSRSEEHRAAAAPVQADELEALDVQRRGRPQVSINATDISFGSPFGFLPQTFDVICSNLAALPIARARSGFPIDILANQNVLGFGFDNQWRPDLVPGIPVWRGHLLNPAAFAIPSSAFSFFPSGLGSPDPAHGAPTAKPRAASGRQRPMRVSDQLMGSVFLISS